MSQQSRIIPNVLKAPGSLAGKPHEKKKRQEFDIDPVALGNEATQLGNPTNPWGGHASNPR